MSADWTLNVLRAFRDAMDAGKADSAVATLIGWPLAAHVQSGYRPFVWFTEDLIDVNDGVTAHRMEVVTGVVTSKDPSVTDQTELEQAITTYYAMRASLAEDAEDAASAFNAAFKGVAQPHPDVGGVKPTDGRDFDGVAVLGERWLVRTGSE